jgi:hypothetical protein
MKWMVIKGVRYPSSVISAFAAYNMDNPFLKVRIRNKYHIVPFDDVNKMASQMVYLIDNYPDFVQIGRWWISKKAVMSWAHALINDDYTGLLDNEEQEIRNFLKRVKADPVSVDWKTEGFYWYNNANNTPGECVDFIFHRCNN